MFLAFSYAMGAAIVCAIVFVGAHNRLIRLQLQAEQALSTVEVVLAERHHVIRQLWQALDMQNQQAVQLLETAERAKSLPVRSAEKQVLERQLTEYTRGLLQHPEQLPGAANHLHFQRSIREVEAQLSAAWRAYNAAAVAYNRALNAFPSNLAGQLRKLEPIPLYQNQ